MFCPNCGKNIPDGSRFCSECGTSLTGKVKEPGMSSWQQQTGNFGMQPGMQTGFAPQPSKKNTKKFVGIGIAVAAIVMIVIFMKIVGGSDKSYGTGEIKVSELFTTEEERIWYWILDDGISYDNRIEEILICKNGEVTFYETLQLQEPRLEDFDGMENEEVIEYLENDLGLYPNQGSVEFHYTRDSTGNKMEQETLEFEGGSRVFFDIERMIEPTEVLSGYYFGLNDGGMSLVTQYDFGRDVQIILNEIDDECMSD